MLVSDVSPKHQVFIEGLAAGEGLLKSAERAGFTNAGRDALPVALTPKVRTLVRNSVRGRIDVEASPESYRVLMRLLRADTTPIGTRVEIAKFFISHSIAAPKAKDENSDAPRELNEMTNEELAAFINKTNGELTDRGMMIDATPKQALDDML